MDVNVELFEAYDSYNDYCNSSDDESSSDVNEMSEEEDNSHDSKEGSSDVRESDDKNSTCSDEQTMIFLFFTEEIQIQDEKLCNSTRRCNTYIILCVNE